MSTGHRKIFLKSGSARAGYFTYTQRLGRVAQVVLHIRPYQAGAQDILHICSGSPERRRLFYTYGLTRQARTGYFTYAQRLGRAAQAVLHIWLYLAGVRRVFYTYGLTWQVRVIIFDMSDHLFFIPNNFFYFSAA